MHINSNGASRSLGLFKLIMITVISVDSIRNIPISAQYGLSLVTFYVFAGLAFLLPLILITARFASEYPNTGGSYLWIEAAFGKKIGFASIWLQWVYQIIWYPTIFAFISTTIVALVHPSWETNNVFILCLSLLFFWLMTAISLFGIKMTAWVSSVGAIVGTLLPMAFMVILAGYWLASGHPSAIAFTWSGLIPNHSDFANLGFFANVLFSLLGLEVAAMHAGDVKAPAQTYKKAMSIAGLLILLSLVLSSLAMCVIITPAKIGLLNGLMDAFRDFLDAFQLGWLVPVVGLAIILGCLGIAFAWIIGLARGLQVACQASQLSPQLQKLNRYHMPYVILLVQALIYSLLVAVFLLFRSINSSYWLLSALTSQFALIYYVLLFAAAIKLRRVQANIITEVLMPVSAIAMSVLGILVGFLPPSIVSPASVGQYEILIISGLIVFCVPLLFIFKKMPKA